MVKGTHKITISTLMICMFVLGLFVPVVTARDAFAPAWMKEGAYVKYVCPQANMAYIFDVTNPQFAGTNYMSNQHFDVINYANATFMWQCISVNTTMAKLQITFDYVGDTLSYWEGSEVINIPLNGESLQLAGEAYVDLYTRAAYRAADGAFLGTTHLWGPANPTDGQEIIFWETDTETITLPVKIDDDSWTLTLQGKQDIYRVSEQVPINGQPKLIGMYYDLDTGLGVDGSFMWDPLMAVVGINTSGLRGPPIESGRRLFAETNINLGPERSTTNWTQILTYTLIPIAIIILIASLIIKRKKRKTNPTQPPPLHYLLVVYSNRLAFLCYCYFNCGSVWI